MTSPNLPGKVLLVDTDATLIALVKDDFEKLEMSLQQANDFNSAIYLFKNQQFDVVIINNELPSGGLTLAQRFRSDENARRSSVGIIMLFGNQTSVEDWNLIKEIKYLEYVEKPMKFSKILPVLSRAMKNRYSIAEVDQTTTLAYDAFRTTGLLQAAFNIIDNNLTEVDDATRSQVKFDLAYQEKKYDEALNIVDSQLQFDAANLSLLNRKAKVLLAMGETEKAIKAFEKCDTMAPDNLKRIEDMAQAYIDAKDPDKAVEKMKQLVELHPDIEDLKFNLVADLQNAGFILHGMQLAQDTNTDPEEVIRYYNNKGVIFAKDGNLDKALKEYYTAVMFYPVYKENYRILFNIALAEINKKTTQGYLAARNAIDKCLELTPDFEKAQKLKMMLEEMIQKAS